MHNHLCLMYAFFMFHTYDLPTCNFCEKKLGVATLSIAANELGVVTIYFTSEWTGCCSYKLYQRRHKETKTTGYFNLKSPTLDLMRRGSQGLGRNDVTARSQAVVSRNTYTIHDLMIDGALNNVLILVVSSISLLLYWPIKWSRNSLFKLVVTLCPECCP